MVSQISFASEYIPTHKVPNKHHLLQFRCFWYHLQGNTYHYTDITTSKTCACAVVLYCTPFSSKQTSFAILLQLQFLKSFALSITMCYCVKASLLFKVPGFHHSNRVFSPCYREGNLLCLIIILKTSWSRIKYNTNFRQPALIIRGFLYYCLSTSLLCLLYSDQFSLFVTFFFISDFFPYNYSSCWAN